MTHIISNQIRCKSCGDEPFSMSVHHYSVCGCEKVAADGGQHYLRRGGHAGDYEELSITIEDRAMLSYLTREIAIAMETGRNPLGVAYAALRGIRDGNLVVKDNHWSVLNDNTL